MNDMAKIPIDHDADRVAQEAGFEGPYDADEIDPQTGLTFGQLDALIQEGLDSGPDAPLDMEKIKRKGRARWEAGRRH